MVKFTRTHTYFMTYKEYKRDFKHPLKQPILNTSAERETLTRKHILFQ